MLGDVPALFAGAAPSRARVSRTVVGSQMDWDWDWDWDWDRDWDYSATRTLTRTRTRTRTRTPLTAPPTT